MVMPIKKCFACRPALKNDHALAIFKYGIVRGVIFPCYIFFIYKLCLNYKDNLIINTSILHSTLYDTSMLSFYKHNSNNIKTSNTLLIYLSTGGSYDSDIYVLIGSTDPNNLSTD